MSGMDQMARDHARDYAAHRAFDEAAGALKAVLSDETAQRRLGSNWSSIAQDLVNEFHERAAQIVRVWD